MRDAAWNSIRCGTLLRRVQWRVLDMSRGMPSMTALLGLLAIAGYQNRDKLGELLKGATGNTAPAGAGNQPGPLGDCSAI